MGIPEFRIVPPCCGLLNEKVTHVNQKIESELNTADGLILSKECIKCEFFFKESY